MLVRACNVYFISRFGFSVMHALSLDMMRLNLARDDLFYLKQNTADLSRAVLIGAEEVVRGVLFPVMRAMLHAVISLFLMVLLVLINPLVAIVTSLALGTALPASICFSVAGRCRQAACALAPIPPGFARRTRFSAASRS